MCLCIPKRPWALIHLFYEFVSFPSHQNTHDDTAFLMRCASHSMPHARCHFRGHCHRRRRCCCCVCCRRRHSNKNGKIISFRSFGRLLLNRKLVWNYKRKRRRRSDAVLFTYFCMCEEKRRYNAESDENDDDQTTTTIVNENHYRVIKWD